MNMCESSISLSIFLVDIPKHPIFVHNFSIYSVLFISHWVAAPYRNISVLKTDQIFYEGFSEAPNPSNKICNAFNFL